MNNEIGSDEQHLEGCTNSSIIMEPMTSERYCETCGTVQNASETSEHYSSDTNPDPQKYHYSSADHKQANHGLGSEITSKEELMNKALEDSQGNKVKGKNKELFSKIKNDKVGYNFKPVNEYRQITRNNVFDSIQHIHQKHSIFPSMINESACHYYLKIIEKNNFQTSKNHKRLGAVCVYLACKHSEEFKISFKELAEDIDESEEKIRTDYNYVYRKMHEKNMELTEAIAKRHTRKMKISLEIMGGDSPERLSVSDRLRKKSLKWLDNQKFEQIISGSNEKSIAAGIMCIVCETNNLKISPEEIAYAFKISSNTVRTQAKNIAQILGIELADKRKKS